MDNLPGTIKDSVKRSPFDKGFLKISFRLEFCLHIAENSLFEVRGKSKRLIGLIYCEDIHEESDSRIGTGKNIELISDVRGAFRFSKINLILPDKGTQTDRPKLSPKQEIKAIYAINKFIDSYKFVTKRFGIENIFSTSGLSELNILSITPNGLTRGLHMINFMGGLTKTKPLRSSYKIDEIKKLTSQPEELVNYTVFNRRAKCLHRGYELQALINAATALELSWKKFHAKLDIKKYSLTKKNVKTLNKKVDIWH